MSLLRLVIATAALVASCNASVGHIVPAVKSVPIVRYAPFYNFPTGARSIHAVAPFAAAGGPLLPAALPPPVLPAPVFSAPGPVFSAPGPVFPAPAPVFPAPAPVFPAPAPVFPAPAPVFPAPAPFPAFAPAPAPVFAAPAPVLPAPAPLYPHLLPRLAPAVPALPTLHGSPLAPVVRVGPAVAPVFPAPWPRAVPFGVPPAHLHYGKFFSPAPLLPSPLVKNVAWK